MTAAPPDKTPPGWLMPPPDTPLYMYGAWVGALHHALGDENIVEGFRLETGMRWTPGKTAIERMIDEATGANEKFLRTFVEWFNARVWGPLD